MAIREILEVPDLRLKTISAPVEPHEFNADLRTLVEDMFETMYDAPGIGLAAVQVGVAERILVIDLQFLGVGRVRVGFDIDGDVVFVHEFDNAGHTPHPYIATASLPVRVGMLCTSDAPVSASMRFVCSSVISEGGQQDVLGYQFGHEMTGTAARP
jgi:hypothetical protein